MKFIKICGDRLRVLGLVLAVLVGGFSMFSSGCGHDGGRIDLPPEAPPAQNEPTSSPTTSPSTQNNGDTREPTVPNPPAHAITHPGDGHSVISWDTVITAVSYKIYWKTSSGVSNSDESISINATSYDHQGLTNGTTYYYAVASVNAVGESALSEEVSATPQVPLPGIPQNMTASPGDAHVALTWDAVAGADSYRIYWKNSSGVTQSDDAINVNTNSYDHASLTNGTTYYYIVAAINAAGVGSISSEVSAMPQVPLPGAPTGLTATPGYELMSVAWSLVTGADSYNIYWSNTSGVNKSSGTKIVGATSPYQHTDLIGGTTYYYVITAVNAAGEGSESAQISAVAKYPLLKSFITSISGNANLHDWGTDAGVSTGLKAADSICQSRAVAASLRGTFKAWISDDDDDAYCRVDGFEGKKAANCGQALLPVAAGPWTGIDGLPFAEKIDSMLSPNLKVYTPPRYDEFGNVVSNGVIFTNTDETGANVGSSCGNWTIDSGSTNGGSSAGTGWDWTNFYWSTDCGSVGHLLCLQTGQGSSLPSFAVSGKTIFVSSAIGDGNLSGWSQAGVKTGLDAADAICQSLADTKWLGNGKKFKAWLSDGTHNAKDQLLSDGPWVRVDGIRVANTKSDLISGSLLAPINLDENGIYIAGDEAWTATKSNGEKFANTCSSWSSNTYSSSSVYGAVDMAGALWTSWYSGHCSESRRLYCIEDQ